MRGPSRQNYYPHNNYSTQSTSQINNNYKWQ